MTSEMANIIWEISVVLVMVIIAGVSFYGEKKTKDKDKKK